jgi:hypothetical protein
LANPIIQSNGSVSGVGSPGICRQDLKLDEIVTLSDLEPTNVGAQYSWTLIDKPIGATSSLIGSSTSSPTITPDVEGSYFINCLVDGFSEANIILAVVLPKTLVRIPAFSEKEQYNEFAVGWHEALDRAMRTYDAMLLPQQSFFISGQGHHDSATPLVVGQISIDPTIWGKTDNTVFKFIVVASVSATATGCARLWNLTDGETVATLSFTSSTATEQTATLWQSNSYGNLKMSPKIYECQIWVTGTAPTNSIELGYASVMVKGAL